MADTRRDLILVTVDDLAGRFLYYDRKEDEELPVGAIQEAIQKGEITIDDILKTFRQVIEQNLG